LQITRRDDLPGAYAALERDRFDALMVRPEPHLMDLIRHEIVAMAARPKLPAIYAFRLAT
jgi:hypothetical protein